ncbi:hypothetical protein FVB32_02400 [Flagellimonas hymeniacidonis]|uniref:Carboxypeptidase-like regulatory domain-containing protein n=1 Tax=Flagellimonas hymeniacidonis TaxID=2603628 RepID=A0A5C8V5X7_9FLAO|nr:hypothetical protein [Flagellimonas hymeniacidonis]TXN37161.1 hypothetical protein FVB32_02400 [Flagellimonas hymeniacidonis]
MKIKLHPLTPILILFLSVSSSAFGQKKTIQLKGKVQNLTNDVSDVLVVNLSTEESTITNTEGFFTLEAKAGDTIQFTAVQYITKKIIVNDATINQNMILINLVENIIKLKEVTVMPHSLTGNIAIDMERINVKPVVTSSSSKLPNSNLGVITHSERLLFEADRGKFVTGGVRLDTISLFPIVGLYMDINVHKTLNYISGRTKTLKNRVSLDKNIKMETEIVNMFPKTTISQEFGIPLKNIDGFLTFCLSQDDFSGLSDMGNTIEIWNYLKSKSQEFKKR